MNIFSLRNLFLGRVVFFILFFYFFAYSHSISMRQALLDEIHISVDFAICKFSYFLLLFVKDMLPDIILENLH